MLRFAVTRYFQWFLAMRHSLSTLRKRLQNGRKLSMLTCYDAGFARAMDEAGIDSLLVGDTLGMVVQGHDSTLPVSVADIAYHVSCIARGSQHPWLVADMPFGSYHENPEQAVRNAVTLMQAGAQMVKLEGGAEYAETVRRLVTAGIPVCGHVGLLPQHIHAMGGFRVQGKEAAQADRIVADALALEAAGAAMLVIEGVPEPLARRVCEATQLITIGIGASVACDGQVLVLHDLLGLTPRPARFVKDFTTGVDASQGGVALAAFRGFAEAVASGRFPTPDHVYAAAPDANIALYGTSGENDTDPKAANKA